MRFGKTFLLIILGTAAVRIAAFPQAASVKRPSFEIASIKPNHSGPGSGGLGTRPGGLFTGTNVTLLLLMRQAYRVQDFQIIGGPAWVNSDRFDIEAKAGEGSLPPRDTIALMLQALLEDRFQLRLHREARDLPEYTLTIRKDSPKLEAVNPPPLPGQPGNGERDTSKGAPLPGSIQTGGGKIQAAAVSLSRFVSVLADQLRRPVIDKTGLTGYYDILLQFNEPEVGPDGREYASGDPEHPSIFTAIQEQLGLKLEPTKGPVEVLVIDSVQKPSEN